jgi:hypothetical protein
VDTPPRKEPERRSASQLKRLGARAREEYDEDRDEWHANFKVLRTPQLEAVHGQLELIVAAGQHDSDRVRGAAVIDALPGLGKTTAANTFARTLDREEMTRYGPVTDEGHERVPVFRVGLTSHTTLRTLNQMICEFYGHPATDRASAAQLASHALDLVLSCQTRVGIIDDVHFIDPRRKDGLDVSNHLKWLANELPVTFIYAGVGLAERRFFAEGLTGENAVLAQTARRWTRLEVPPFEIVSPAGRQHWQSLLKATEQHLVLAQAWPGMLTALADYLFERSSGHIGSYVTLITRGCFKAIRTGEEKLTRQLLDTVRIDEASEQARQQLAAAFAAGRLSSRPAAPRSAMAAL